MKLAYTTGDPSGIGLEIYHKVKNLNHEKTLGIELVLVDDLRELEAARQFQAGPSARSGEHAYQSLKAAHELALSKKVSGIITGPVSKGSLNLAGYKFNGQTEVLAHLNGLKNSDLEMIFIYGNFRTLLASRHIAIKDVPAAYIKNIKNAIEHGIHALFDLYQIPNPRIAVAGLNPHAGEGGLFGDEERLIAKDLASLREKYPQVSISDPLSADSMFAQAAQSMIAGKEAAYDLYVAAYHDQALPLIKGISGFAAVNLSYGLPYLRMSMDHGTGFDIAGKGIASEDGLVSCMKLFKSLLDSEKEAILG